MPTPETGPSPSDRLAPPEAAIGPAVTRADGAVADGAPGAVAQASAPAPATVDRKRQPSGDEARGRAMRAAIAVIAEKGTGAVRMSEIAARAGMSTGHILYHFGKKDRLLLEVLAWSQADLWSRFQQAADEAASPAEKLDLFVRCYLPRHQGDERYALWTQVLAQRHDEAGRRVLTELLDGWDDRLEAILREGRDLGQFADVELPDFTIRAVAMLSGISEDVMLGRSRWQHTSPHAFALSALERELRPTGR
ncbi:TetR/AcrR family transcriptional regulator [Streptomyces venezuelae]|uniref:TetR/AcrR family transcriptional regulator n=1 Tax=Streptomyces venezuelae TaxID=54571 RepID=UPI003321A029